MRIEHGDVAEVEAAAFARRFPLRAGNLMWFLGAGASAAAGVPTAWDMTWEFKQQLYVSQKRVSLKIVADLSNPSVRHLLQQHIDAAGRFPPPDAPDEYAALFEEAYPHEGDRRTYIDGKLRGGKPSFGHLALATFMMANQTKLVWTTNFDPLVADACAKVYDSTSRLTTVSLDTADTANQVITEGRWPAEIKLHGDFRSRRLKNTNDELRDQDARLRQALVDSCRRFGMVVAGYSGRDESIMEALESVLTQPNAFPAGLFWLHRGQGAPLPRVEKLLRLAQQLGVDGGLVRIEGFDETLRDLVRITPGLTTTAIDTFASERRIWTPPSKPTGQRSFPVVRLNGLPLAAFPEVCRLVECKIGGHAEVVAAANLAGVSVLVGRIQSGILAFGADADLRKAFAPYDIKKFDIYPIESKRLRYDSGVRGLLREALSRALAREHNLLLTRRRNSDTLAPAAPADPAWRPLRELVKELSGKVPNHPELQWREGISVRLDWADEKLWLLIEPRTVFQGGTPENRAAQTDFARERTVRRYNQQLNALIDFWAQFLYKDGAKLHALGITSGIDAVFELGQTTAFSHRVNG